MSERTDITEQDVDFVLAVLRTRYPEDTREPPRDRLRQALVDGWWSIEEQRAVASVALAARLAQQDDAVTDARHNLILQTICRLPDVLTSGDWEQWLEQHRSEWLNDDRAFGGWIAQRLGDTLSRLAQFEALAERARRKGERGPISALEYDLAVLRREGGA